MATTLTVTGAAFELVGLTLVFIELAVIRSHEFGTPPPWARVAGRIRRLLKRPRVIHLSAADAAIVTDEARVKMRPAPNPPDAADAQRLERLERYVDLLDRDLDSMWQSIGQRADKVIAEAARRDQQLRQEIEQREADRRAKLRPSLIRQGFGVAFVLVGLVLGTVGAVL